MSTETQKIVDNVLISDRYALVLRTIERNALLDQRDELVAALKAMRGKYGRTRECFDDACTVCDEEIAVTKQADAALAKAGGF